MSDTAYKIKVMQAFENGKAIDGWNGDTWVDCPEPSWQWLDGDYRIKPEPLELWVNVPAVGGEDAVFVAMPGSITWFSTRQGAQNACGALSKPTLFRQVLDSDAE